MRAVCLHLGAVAAVLLGGISNSKSEDLADLVEKVEPAVVQVLCDHDIFGSGVVIDAGGTVATNYHVIEGTRHAAAKFRDGKTVRILGYLAIDPGHDLALLKLDQKHGKLASVPLAANLPRKGEKVAAFGAPKGLTFTTSEGIVSALRTGSDSAIASEFARHGYERNATWVQTTAAISPGNSGGPLINMTGQIVGLNTIIYTSGNNLNFAISVNDLRALSARAGDVVQDLSTLPPPRHATSVVANDEFKVKFPSGRVLSSSLIRLDAQLILNAMKKGTHKSVSLYPGGTLKDKISLKNDAMNGPAAMYYETGGVKLFSTYEEGKRHGPVNLFDDDHHLVYWGQFDKGKRDGLAFIAENEDIRLVAEYHLDKMEAVHLLNDLVIEKSFQNRDEAAQNETAKPLLDKLAEVDGQLKKYEAELKKQVYADAQKAQKERQDKAKARTDPMSAALGRLPARLLAAAAIAWASPATCLGLAIGLAGLLSGGRVQRRGRVLEFCGGAADGFLRRLFRGASAMTLGHVVLGRTPHDLDRSRAHERVHVRQYERWGPFFLPAYLLCSLVLWMRGMDSYLDNPFEREAYDKAP